MTGNAVELRHVTRRFNTEAGPVTAIGLLSAQIRSGKLTGIVGPDGAGKTTLMRLIAGLLLPDEGSVQAFGASPGDDAADLSAYPEAESAIGYMPQRFGLYEDLSVQQNLDLYAALHGVPSERRPVRFEQLLRFTALAPFTQRLAGRLSGGMKQKLGLACTLIGRPALLLLDEPSVGVDPVSRRELWSIVRELVARGTTAIWNTAYLDEAERCDDVILLDRGHVLAMGPPASLTRPLVGRTYVLPIGGANKRALQRKAAAHPAVLDALVQGRNLRLVVAPGSAPPSAAELGSANEVQPVEPRFEDAFVARLGEADAHAPAARDMAVATHSVPPDARDVPIIEARELTRDFGSFRAVDRVSFAVRRGEIFGLLGPNGAGKSTTFRMLCGLLPPSAGTATVAGIDLGTAPAKARERLGYMSQKFSLYANLSVRENVEFFAGVYGLGGTQRAERVAWALATFDLGPHARRPSGDLPLGFKQRLSLACALLHEPPILFLDEPTSGVDPLTRREFWQRINAMAEAGVTVLVTSHFMDEAEYCDRLGVVYRGRMIATGTPDDLKARFQSARRREPTLEDAFIGLIEAYDRENPL